jgi:hypothetical protein
VNLSVYYDFVYLDEAFSILAKFQGIIRSISIYIIVEVGEGVNFDFFKLICHFFNSSLTDVDVVQLYWAIIPGLNLDAICP